MMTALVIPAKYVLSAAGGVEGAGIQDPKKRSGIPAFAGMTAMGVGA
jgi:hypothetical protein